MVSRAELRSVSRCATPGIRARIVSSSARRSWRGEGASRWRWSPTESGFGLLAQDLSPVYPCRSRGRRATRCTRRVRCLRTLCRCGEHGRRCEGDRAREEVGHRPARAGGAVGGRPAVSQDLRPCHRRAEPAGQRVLDRCLPVRRKRLIEGRRRRPGSNAPLRSSEGRSVLADRILHGGRHGAAVRTGPDHGRARRALTPGAPVALVWRRC